MKNEKSIILFLMLLLLACSSENKNTLNDVWISYNWVEELEPSKLIDLKEEFGKDNNNSEMKFEKFISDIYTNTNPNKQIFKFNDDKLEIIIFDKSNYNGYSRHNFNYKCESDSIFVYKGSEQLLRYKIEHLNRNELILTYTTKRYISNKNKIKFRSITSFSPIANTEIVKSFLNENSVKINTSLETIYFTESTKFCGKIKVQNSTNEYNFKTDQYWGVIKMQGELFLHIGSELIQIIRLNEKTLTGLIIADTNKEIHFHKTY